MDVHCEHHCAVVQPILHGLVENDSVSDCVGNFHDDILHNVQNNKFDEILLLKCFAHDDLVGDLTVFIAIVLHLFLFLVEYIGSGSTA